MDANLDAKANLSLAPTRSQIFVVLMSIMSGLAFVVGCVFLWNDKPTSWLPLLFSLVFCGLAGFAWLRSHRNADFEGAHPTVLQITGNGVQLETDSRTFVSQQPFQQLERLMSMVGHRLPLPEPDGLVSESGTPVPESKDEAIRRVQMVNSKAEKAASQALKLLSGSGEDLKLAMVEQPPVQLQHDAASVSGNAPGSN